MFEVFVKRFFVLALVGFFGLIACSPAQIQEFSDALAEERKERELKIAYEQTPEYRFACTDDRGLAGRTVLSGNNVCGVAVKNVFNDSRQVNVGIRVNYAAAVGEFLAPKWENRWIDFNGNFPIRSNGFATFQFAVFVPPRVDFFGNITRSLFDSLLIAAPGIIGAAIGIPIPNTVEAAATKFITDSIDSISQAAKSNKLRFLNVTVCFNVTGSKYTTKTNCFQINQP
jgi:hypothetical protein